MTIPPPQQLPPRGAVQEAAHRILSGPDFNLDPDREIRLLADLWKRITGWFEKLGGLHETAPVLYWVLLIGCSVLLGLILGHVGLVIYRVVRRPSERRALRAKGTKEDTPAALLDAARRSAGAGAIAEALTLYLRSALAGLDRRRILRRTDTATVREYAAMLRKQPAELKDFSLLLQCYEPAVFGHKAPPPEAVAACDAAVEAMIRHAR